MNGDKATCSAPWLNDFPTFRLISMQNHLLAAWLATALAGVDSEESKEAEAQEFVTSLLGPEDRMPVKSQRRGVRSLEGWRYISRCQGQSQL